MTDLRERVSHAFGARYAVERELGRGGMAIVYLAQDSKHDRPVALKVLRPEVASALGSARFLREIRIAARLSHPHILPLFDSGEAEGLLYYVMPFVDGPALRTEMERRGQFPIEEALHITGQVAGALEFAHQAGIIHRDIKPENILLHGNQALVADFGIALAVSAAGGQRFTETGLIVGTPAYMSFEQAAGEEQIDARADLYSLASVLFEMLAGSPPYTGPNAASIIAKLYTEPVPDLRDFRDDIPAELSAVMHKALAKAAEQRFRTVADFVEALTNPVVGSAIAPPEQAGKSIAVLPFINLSADADNEYFCDGMTDELINALTQIPTLRVAARTSSFAYKGKQQNVRTIGEELRVGAVVEGSVRKSANRLRITAQLVNVSNGYQLWSQRYDREADDVFAVQDELAAGIAEILKVRLSHAPGARIINRGTNDLEAYHLYLRGRHFWYARDMARAVQSFEAAIARDANYALAYSGLADAYCVLAHYGFLPPSVGRQKATDAAERAVAIDDGLAEAHCSLGLTHVYFGWDFRLAERAFRKALTLKPSLALAHGWLGVLYGFAGRYEQAALHAGRATEDEPLSPLLNCLVCIAHFYSRRFEAAMVPVETALEIAADFGPAQWCLSLPRSARGEHGRAIELLLRSAQNMRQSPWVVMLLGGAYAQAGRHAEAREILESLHARAETQFIPAICFGWIHLRLDEVDEAYAWFEKSFEERDAMAWFFAGWPGLEWLRGEPAWNALLERAGVVPVGTHSLEQPRVPLHARTGNYLAKSGVDSEFHDESEGLYG
jgi:serine/threonine-protein kinase